EEKEKEKKKKKKEKAFAKFFFRFTRILKILRTKMLCCIVGGKILSRFKPISLDFFSNVLLSKSQTHLQFS
ncbi:hypothetical protein V1478_017537, partial [Vespula squamosa]